MVIGYYLRPLLIFLQIHAAVSVRPETHHLDVALEEPVETVETEPAEAAEEPAEEIEDVPAPKGASLSYCKQKFEASHSGTYMKLGTRENMDPRLAELELDFTGLWWMKGNPLPEVLSSFAGATVNSSEYPVLLNIPHGRNPGHWGWKQSFIGSALMTLYSSSDQSGKMNFNMESPTRGSLATGLQQNPVVLVEEWGFEIINKDEWNRTTSFQERSPWKPIIADSWYTLTRILNEDGSPTQFWAEFLESDDAKSGMQNFASNDACAAGLASEGGSTHSLMSLVGVKWLLVFSLICCVPACGFACLRRRTEDEDAPVAEPES